MNWTPNHRKGALFGAGWVLAVLVVDGLLLWRAIGGPLNGWTFICALLVLFSLPVIALICYWVYGLMCLRYEFDRNRLVIITASSQQIIPMSSIERLVDGRDAGLQVKKQSVIWPGYWIGHGVIQGIGLTLFYAVTPPDQQAIVVTPSLAYGISVPDMDTFMDVFRAALAMGSSVEVKQESQKQPYLSWTIWRDRLMQVILSGGLAVNLTLFGMVTFRYSSLPLRLPMHYDVTGAVDRIAERSEVFDLPMIGLLIWALNGFIGAALYHRQRVASYLSWGGAWVVQVFFFLALCNILR